MLQVEMDIATKEWGLFLHFLILKCLVRTGEIPVVWLWM